MKRIIALLLVLCLCLCACGKKDTTETTAAATTEATVPPTTVAPTTEPETEPPTEATEPIVLVHPLTGEPLDEPFTGRPMASTINNAPACLPQYGISQADWIFEAEVEGGVTRCLGIFTDLENIGTIGPVRSARTFLISFAASFGAPLAHCGGSSWALEHQHAYGQYLDNYLDLDEMQNSSYFYRDTNRQSQGYAFEHTLFTSGDRLLKAMADKGFDAPLDENGVDYGYTFADTVPLKGDPAEKITISFLGTKTTKMNYNEKTGAYEAYQRGGDWIDGATGQVLSFENVIVLFSDQSKYDGYHSFYDLYSGGTGYLAIEGKIVPIDWAREDVYHPFALYLKDGTPVTLKTGHTFVAVSSPSGSVTFG